MYAYLNKPAVLIQVREAVVKDRLLSNEQKDFSAVRDVCQDGRAV